MHYTQIQGYEKEMNFIFSSDLNSLFTFTYADKNNSAFLRIGSKNWFWKKNRIRGNNHLLRFKPLHRIKLNCFYFAIFFIGQYLRRVLPYLEFWLVTLSHDATLTLNFSDRKRNSALYSTMNQTTEASKTR